MNNLQSEFLEQFRAEWQEYYKLSHREMRAPWVKNETKEAFLEHTTFKNFINNKNKSKMNNQGTLTKVKSVQSNGTWDSQHGTMYKFEYTMEDNTVINALHKSATPFNSGDDVEYIITKTNEYGNSGKVMKPQQNVYTPNQSSNQNKGSVNDSILYQVCLKGAIDFMVANANASQFTPEAVNETALEMAKIAKENISKL